MGHNKKLEKDLIINKTKKYSIMKKDMMEKRKGMLRRTDKCMYYTVYLFATSLFVLCGCNNIPDSDDDADPPALATDPPTLATDPPALAADPPTLAADSPTLAADSSALEADPPALAVDPPALEAPEGPTWKLEGFADAETDVLTKVVPRKGHFDVETGVITDGEPFECEKCYTLTFSDNEAELPDGALYTAVGWSLMNGVNVYFFDPLQLGSTRISFSKRPLSGGTKIGEPPTPSHYTNALHNLTSYTCYNGELKLFYNNDKNYLLYKLIQQ
jgi:hypothetical protein